MKSDAEIRNDVIDELRWDPQIPESDAIGVAVTDGAVTLTGHVATYAQKLAAVRAAERVEAVADEIKVELAGMAGTTLISPRRSPASSTGMCRSRREWCMPGWRRPPSTRPPGAASAACSGARRSGY